MGSKLSIVLSSIFMIFALLIGIDFTLMQMNFASVDAAASTIGTYFSNYGGELVIKEAQQYVEELLGLQSKVTIIGGSSEIGEMLYFKIEHYYKPIIINKNNITISVKRSAYIGKYISKI